MVYYTLRQLARKRKLIAIICLLYLIIYQPIFAQCVASGPRSGSVAASVAVPGSDVGFNNASYSLMSDNSSTQAAPLVALLNWQSERLEVTNFGFSIPPEAIICGIQAEVEKRADDIGINIFLLESYVTDLSVRIIKNGVVTGNNLAVGAHWANTDGYTGYGGSGNTWGETWMPADVNANNFGVAISTDVHGLLGLLPKVLIDHIRLTVYYFIPPLLSTTYEQPHKRLLTPDHPGIRCFPNPFISTVEISGVSPGQQVYITDIVGRTVCSFTKQGLVQPLNLSWLPSGLYFVRVGNNVKKMRKQ